MDRPNETMLTSEHRTIAPFFDLVGVKSGDFTCPT